MTSHPPEPPAPWPPPAPEERQAGRGQPAEAPGEWRPGRGQHPGTPEEWPDYPDLPDYPPDSYSPRDTYFSGYPSMPDYPPMPDYPAAVGYQPAGYPSNGYPAGAYLAHGHPSEAYAAAGQPPAGYPARGSQVVEFPPADGGRALAAAAPVTHEEYLRPGHLPDARWAMLGYLTVPFFGFLVPLAIYLTSLRRSRWLRAHAAQAVNVWLTVALYELSAAIIGAILVLDSPRVALAVVVPLVAALLLTALVFLLRAAAAAYRGQAYTIPRWLSTPLVR